MAREIEYRVGPILFRGIADYESISETSPLLRLNRYEDPDSKDVITRDLTLMCRGTMVERIPEESAGAVEHA